MSLFDKTEKCNRCKGKLDGWDYNHQGGLCGSCSFRRGFILAVSFFIVAFIISIPITIFQFNYDLEKCEELDSKESSYDFTNRIEIDARYNERCYFINKHPLALPSYFVNGILASVAFGLLGFLILMFTKPRNFRRVEDKSFS